MKTKPFDLQEALEHPERVVTRDGRKVTELFYAKTAERDCRVIVIIDGYYSAYSETGMYLRHGECGSDLVMHITPEPHRPLPEGVEMPRGYRLLEKGEKLLVGALVWFDVRKVWAADAGYVVSDCDCWVVPDYSTGLWKEAGE